VASAVLKLAIPMKILLSLLALITPLLCCASDLSLEVLREVNLARTAPQQYAQFVEERLANYQGQEGHRVVDEAVRFLRKAKPLPPLTFSPGLSNAALVHVLEQGPSGKRGHGNPWERIARFGAWSGSAGENIHYGANDPRSIVISLIVDDGVRGRKHRVNIFSRNFRVTGVACGAHSTMRAMCVMEFAGGFVERGTSPIAGL